MYYVFCFNESVRVCVKTEYFKRQDRIVKMTKRFRENETKRYEKQRDIYIY